MKNSKVLEMLQQNRIEELKAELQDEIFTESLKTKPNAKKRYAAMKRYLKTISESRPILTKPCEIEFDGEKYNSFTNSYSLALTKESCGELEMCSEPERYPDVKRLIILDGEEDKIDFNKFFIALDGNYYESIEAAKEAGIATINYGTFITNFIDFILIALVVFFFLKFFVNKLKKQEPQKEEPAKPKTKTCPFCKTDIHIEATRCPNCTSI